MPAKKPAPKTTPPPKKRPLNMGLGKLKGSFQERKARLDAEIDRQTGARPRKKK